MPQKQRRGYARAVESGIDPRTLTPGTCIEYETDRGGELRRSPGGIFLGITGSLVEVGWDDGTSLGYDITQTHYSFRILRAWQDPTALSNNRLPNGAVSRFAPTGERVFTSGADLFREREAKRQT